MDLLEYTSAGVCEDTSSNAAPVAMILWFLDGSVCTARPSLFVIVALFDGRRVEGFSSFGVLHIYIYDPVWYIMP